MIERQKGVTTLVQLIGIYFDRLVSPGFAEQVIADLKLCFYNSEARSREFVSVLTRIVWEYNFVNKMFVTNYKLLSSKVHQGQNRRLPAEVLVFGGTYPLSPQQVKALTELVVANPVVRSLSFNFTRMRDEGMKVLMEALKP